MGHAAHERCEFGAQGGLPWARIHGQFRQRFLGHCAIPGDRVSIGSKQTKQLFGDEGRGWSSLAQQRYDVRSRCQLANPVQVVRIPRHPPLTDPASPPGQPTRPVSPEPLAGQPKRSSQHQKRRQQASALEVG